MNDVFTTVSYSFVLGSHMSRFEGGVFKLPKFQRGFVWSREQTLLFADSLEKGYPVSSLVFAQLDRTSVDMYVLDGQQRIVSLLLLKHGVFPTESGREVLCSWMRTNPVWESLEPLFKDQSLFEIMDEYRDLYERMEVRQVLPSVELRPSRGLSYEEYTKHIKECFKRLNTAGTSMSDTEIELLLSNGVN